MINDLKVLIKRMGTNKIITFILILLVQIVLLYSLVNLLSNILAVFGIAILTFITLVLILNNYSDSEYKISWIITILVLPGIGSILYYFIRFNLLNKQVKLRFEKTKKEVNEKLDFNYDILNSLKYDSYNMYGIASYLVNKGNYPLYKDSKVTYLKNGEEYYKYLISKLEDAKDYILLEYFIINNDYMWQSILNILIKKAKEGLDVRVMYDGFGSMITLPSGYKEYLERNGIKCSIFSKVKPFLMLHQNNRDHRKIVVIDGKYAFTGGINIANEYMNKVKRFGYWKDTGVLIEGNSVNTFVAMYFELWNTINKDKMILDKYIINTLDKGDGYYIPFGDTPFDNKNLCEDVYLNIINNSRKYVYITTPYLILDSHLRKALINASNRGVDVRIILPHIPDKKYCYALQVSEYKRLISEGIKIYEFTPGFIHAKMVISDDIIGTVGTTNFDYRSLYLHFECTMLMYKSSTIKSIKEDILNTIDASILMDKKGIKEINIVYKILGNLLKLIAPLL